MAGSRKIQRSVRVSLAMALMVVTVLIVGLAVVSSTLVAPAALVALVAGATATRIMHGEVVQTRWEAARVRAQQARSFQETIDRDHARHQTYSLMMATRVSSREQQINELGGTVRLLERRAEDAEARVRREARRANEAQERLAAVLDEILGTADADAAAEPVSDRSDLPTVVDLLGWDAKVSAAAAAERSDRGAATVA